MDQNHGTEQKTLKNGLKMASQKKSSLKRRSPGFLGDIGINSALTQDAQTATVCDVPELESRRLAAVQVVEKVARMRGHRDAIVLDLLLVSGCRVSEVCGIEPKDILSNTQVYVKGLKGSASRICTLGIMHDFLDFKYRLGFMWNRGLNRWYVYRMCKEFGVYEQILGNKKLAVTHAGRHELVAGLEKAGLRPEEIAELIGHRNVNSTKHYLRHRPKGGLLCNEGED